MYFAFNWLTMRSWIVWGGSLVLQLGIFLLVAYGTGWPASTAANGMLEPHLYCEAFNLHDVETGARGVREPVNTWSNLYAILTSAFVAFMLFADRANPHNPRGNVIRSDSLIADAFIFVVMFLGLGSMWLHASLSKYFSWLDGLSMYLFAGYLVFYTLNRRLMPHLSATVRAWIFWPSYLTTVILFTIIGHAGASSELLIGILVLIYLGLEFFFLPINAFRVRSLFIAEPWACLFWTLAALAMLNATMFRHFSVTGGPMCVPDSSFQPHGLLWHTLAGVMAVMLYLYWRREGVGTQVAAAPAPSTERWT